MTINSIEYIKKSSCKNQSYSTFKPWGATVFRDDVCLCVALISRFVAILRSRIFTSKSKNVIFFPQHAWVKFIRIEFIKIIRKFF